MAPPKNVPIGQILLENGFITKEQLEDALLKQQQSEGKMLGDVMLEMNLVSETQLAQALSIRLKVPFVDLSTTQINREAVMKIPEEKAREKIVLAYAINNNRLMVATNDPINFYVFEELKVQTGMEIIPQISTKTAIEEAIGKFYSQQNVDQAVNDLNDSNQPEQNAVDVESVERVDNAPIVKLVNMMAETAFRLKATDIHIEAFKTRTRIRFRMDGELVEQDMKVPIAFHNSIITRIKILGGMNIAEKRIPLDGRYSMIIDGVQQDFRVSTIPCVWGEKCVIRLLSSADEKARKITDLGMTDYNYEMYKQIIRCPNGVMLVTGPTGSGKSTTLYATLGELSQPNVNIVTVEDPVEYSMAGINQTQVNVKANMTFAAALRSILRQDPDIIMIGEIRDEETAEIAVRSAITGHLVFSTLHTNDAPGAIVRLEDMKVKDYLVADALVGVIAQRLVKRICPACRKRGKTNVREMEILGIDEPIVISRPQGCQFCNNTGYKGRIAVHELMYVNDKMRNAILEEKNIESLRKVAGENGMTPLWTSCRELVFKGVTSIHELMALNVE